MIFLVMFLIITLVIDENKIVNIKVVNPGTNYKINDINLMYINRGPGSFAGIRNSLSMIKAIHMIKKIDYYCFSFRDFKGEKDLNYENIPNLCEKFKIEKNLINPIY